MARAIKHREYAHKQFHRDTIDLFMANLRWASDKLGDDKSMSNFEAIQMKREFYLIGSKQSVSIQVSLFSYRM